MAQWCSYGGSWKWVTILPILIGIVQLLFAICFCIPSYVHQQLLSLDCQNLQLSSVLYLSWELSLCRVSSLKGDIQFSKLFKDNLYRCVHIKVHWKTFHPFYIPPFSPLVCPPYRFKGSPEYASWNVLHQTSLRNYASFSLQVSAILSILLDEWCTVMYTGNLGMEWRGGSGLYKLGVWFAIWLEGKLHGNDPGSSLEWCWL